MTGQEQPPQGCSGDDFQQLELFFSFDTLLLFIYLLIVKEQKQDLSQMRCGCFMLLLVHMQNQQLIGGSCLVRAHLARVQEGA